jgi:hypothetical protein
MPTKRPTFKCTLAPYFASVFIAAVACNSQTVDRNVVTSEAGPDENPPTRTGRVEFDDIGALTFDPSAVKTVRPDLFNEGYFSLFDVLVHLADRGDISLTYHFDESLDTHVIDSMEGLPYWWYDVFYHGGWSESSNHRIDYYPVKDKMFIRMYQDTAENNTRRIEVWQTGVTRRASNQGAVMVPRVIIRAPGKSLLFENVLVEPHDTRSDFLVPGTITALDVVQSLGDQGKLIYQIVWYERIGSAEIKNYYVDRIDEWLSTGMCGFVYEIGELNQNRGNHIHLQTDLRIMQSPEYVEFFWIELGPC